MLASNVEQYTLILEEFLGVSGGIVWEVTSNDGLQRRRNWSLVLLLSGAGIKWNHENREKWSENCVELLFPCLVYP